MQQRTIATLSILLFVAGILWGGFTFIVYMGIPVHNLVYVTGQENTIIGEACPEPPSVDTDGTQLDIPISYYLCRGSMAIEPFIKNFVLMSMPFVPYVLASVLLLVLITGYAAYRHGTFSYSFNASPWMLIAAFAFAVWLLGTTFSLGSLDNGKQEIRPPFHRFYEASLSVYDKAGPEGIDELKANFDRLNARGCLRDYGEAQNGAKLYDLSALCMQTALFSRVGTQLLLVALFLLNLLIAGSAVLLLIDRTTKQLQKDVPLLWFFMSLGVGIATWITVLWILALGGWLEGAPVRVLFFGLPIVCYRFTWQWLKAAFTLKWPITVSFSAPTLLVWLLMSYLSLNFLNVVRPFPIGWDDLGSYLNVPKLLASYGSFLPSLSQFRWEYLSSLGYLLFGITPDSGWDVIGSTFAMQINWSSGLIGVLVSYAFGRIFFGPRGGLITAIMYYLMPMVGHFSFADMKIDNAVYFAIALSLLSACVYLFGTPGIETEHSLKGDRRLLLFSGMMAGLGFGFKPTAILGLFMVLSLIFAESLGLGGFLSSTFLSFFIISVMGPLDFRSIGIRVTGAEWNQQSAQIACILIALGAFAAAYWRRKKEGMKAIERLGRNASLFLGAAVIICLPWMLVNASTNDWSLSPNGMLKAADPTMTHISVMTASQSKESAPATNTRYLPEDLALNPEHPACKTSAKVEELDRYWGYSSGLSHYLTLPWRQVMNIDSFGYYVTYVPILLLIPFVLLLPYAWRREGRWLRMLFGVTMVYLCQWIFVGNGIGWYGIGMFIGFSVILEAMIARAPDSHNRTLWSILMTLSILICLMNRLWQFDAQRNIFEYPLGKISASALREMTIPDYDDVAESIIERSKAFPEQPYTYRMGTFIPYFVPRNRELIPVADNQLGMFNCLNQELNHPLTLKRLKALGFNGMVFDTNTATIEKDEKGSLHQKVDAFINFASDPVIGLQAAVNNPENGIIYLVFP